MVIDNAAKTQLKMWIFRIVTSFLITVISLNTGTCHKVTQRQGLHKESLGPQTSDFGAFHCLSSVAWSYLHMDIYDILQNSLRQMWLIYVTQWEITTVFRTQVMSIMCGTSSIFCFQVFTSTDSTSYLFHTCSIGIRMRVLCCRSDSKIKLQLKTNLYSAIKSEDSETLRNSLPESVRSAETC